MKNEIFETQFRQGRVNEASKFPKVVLIDTISYCDLRCTMCGHKDMTRKRGIMPWNLFTKIIDETAEVDKNVRVWMVFFGEALILKKRKPTIFEMIAYAKNKGLTDVVLNSNANLLDEEAVRDLIDSDLDAIYIGIDAFTPETYSQLRVGGNYNKVVGNVKNLIRIKKELNVETPKVYVQFVEMDINAHEKGEFINFWKDQGAIVKIRPKVSWAGLIGAPNLVLGSEDRWPCYWAMQTMSIADTGKVVTCAVDVDARFVAGDVNKQSLREIWNGKLKELRQLHISEKFEDLPDPCRECNDWQSARADYYSLNS
ncbi:MAG: radical SAM protein [Gammaproteobacteria bacterium]|nr:radical SAM protein [Gammaproteobacteria bacterium]